MKSYWKTIWTRRIHAVIYLLVCSYFLSCRSGQEDIRGMGAAENIRLNQVGYEVDCPKKFIVVETGYDDFNVLDEEGRIRHKGSLVENGTWDASGEMVKIGDFTDLKEPGAYRIAIGKDHVSHPFLIGDNIFMDAAIDGLKSFYLQRMSMDIHQKYAGVYRRSGGHPDTVCYFHPSTGKPDGQKSSPGGWYDAGDYGKYIVNAAITAGTMLALHEIKPVSFPDGSLWIPESGNGKSDLLDEIKYELDWMLTMQDDDGGIFHKLTTKNFEGFVMPAEANGKRYIIGKSTAAALDFTATMAMAARLYLDYDPVFAEQCEQAALEAWSWATKHPEEYYAKNPDDIFTGAYNDVVLDEEWFWAASELYITTGEEEFYLYIDDRLDGLRFRVEESWRNYVDNIGYYSLLTPFSPLSEENKSRVKQRLYHVADSLSQVLEAHPYRIPVDHFKWGSNSDFLNAAMLFTVAYHYSGNSDYRKNVCETVDYIFGKNATGYSFVTGYGNKSPMHIHHRQSAADDVLEPFPGFVVGGPNVDRQDQGDLRSSGKAYESMLPAKSYVDERESYASNEICINWNAPFVFVLGYFSDTGDI